MTTAPDISEKSRGPSQAHEDLSPRDILKYLRRHPDFFQLFPNVLYHMEIPGPREIPNSAGAQENKAENDEALVDFQSVRISKLKREIVLLQKERDLVISRSQHNKLTQDCAHQAALSLLEAHSLENLLERLSNDLPKTLSLDRVVLAIEEAIPFGQKEGEQGKTVAKILSSSDHAMEGIVSLPLSSLQKIIEGKTILLRDSIEGNPMIYGAKASLIRSEALIELAVSPRMPSALLAFGSRQVGNFHPEQGTELLAFLARVTENTLRRWLHPTKWKPKEGGL